MFNTLIDAPKFSPQWAVTMPPGVQTPAFVIHEQGVVQNLRACAQACGGVDRLMPHVKTHRAGWVVKRCLNEGVKAFKASTVAEVEMVLASGAPYVVWAYPTVNKANINAVIQAAAKYPQARVGALVDSVHGAAIWREALAHADSAAPNLKLIVDLDPGMGRTGASINQVGLDLALELHELGRMSGFHVYDGHIQGDDLQLRTKRIDLVIEQVEDFLARAAEAGLATELIAGGSYSFNVWPDSLARYVGPGSWTYSSDQHDSELGPLGWEPSAYVLATVIATKGDTATLDAGAKAISPDKPLPQRFRWPARILMMSEEHVVVENTGLVVGDRVLLMPRHACTTAYLYDTALVLTTSGEWSQREQLGNRR